jgi:hypothetical protein
LPLTPGQQRTRHRVERVIGLAAPFLDVVLAVGERISRIAEPEDYEYYPVRTGELSKQDPDRPKAISGRNGSSG